ncbi:MAG: hypothetical protein ACRC33_21360 [Gemmataceae bacterium]
MASHAPRLEPLEGRAAPAAVGPSAEQLEAEARRAALMIAAPVPPLPTVTLLPGGHARPDELAPPADAAPVPEELPPADAAGLVLPWEEEFDGGD